MQGHWSWRFRTLGRGDYAAILLVIAVTVLAAFGLVRVPYGAKGNAPGFGPSWDCTDAGQGNPVCVKKAPAPSN